jgi:hypothetical protein
MYKYRCEATSLGGFVQQLAVSYVARGYRFYVTGYVPERKDPRTVDEKLIDRYGIDVSKSERSRRKLAGGANLHYIRLGRFFVLIATKGKHRFYEDEGDAIRDCGRVSIKCGGYSIGLADGHPRVLIELEEHKRLKAYFIDLAVCRSREWLEAELERLPFEPYAPVRRQLLTIHRAVNRARKEAGFEPVSKSCLRFKRRIYRPFESGEGEPHGRIHRLEEPSVTHRLIEK